MKQSGWESQLYSLYKSAKKATFTLDKIEGGSGHFYMTFTDSDNRYKLYQYTLSIEEFFYKSIING